MRVLTILAALLFALPAAAAEPPEVLRARAALALAFAAPLKPATYAEAYTQAAEERKPLVVFVGQPAKELAGCVCVAVETFPDTGRAVVVGLPTATGFRRVDLPGQPDDAAIRAVIATKPAAILPPLTRCDPKTGCVRQ